MFVACTALIGGDRGALGARVGKLVGGKLLVYVTEA